MSFLEFSVTSHSSDPYKTHIKIPIRKSYFHTIELIDTRIHNVTRDCLLDCYIIKRLNKDYPPGEFYRHEELSTCMKTKRK